MLKQVGCWKLRVYREEIGVESHFACLWAMAGLAGAAVTAGGMWSTLPGGGGPGKELPAGKGDTQISVAFDPGLISSSIFGKIFPHLNQYQPRFQGGVLVENEVKDTF